MLHDSFLSPQFNLSNKRRRLYEIPLKSVLYKPYKYIINNLIDHK